METENVQLLLYTSATYSFGPETDNLASWPGRRAANGETELERRLMGQESSIMLPGRSFIRGLRIKRKLRLCRPNRAAAYGR